MRLRGSCFLVGPGCLQWMACPRVCSGTCPVHCLYHWRSVPSPSFQMIPSWGDWVIYWGVGLPATGTETAWWNGTTGNLWNSTRTNAKSCTHEERGPCSDVGQDLLNLVKRWLWGHTVTQEKPPSTQEEVAGDGDDLLPVILGGRIRDSCH